MQRQPLPPCDRRTRNLCSLLERNIKLLNLVSAEGKKLNICLFVKNTWKTLPWSKHARKRDILLLYYHKLCGMYISVRAFVKLTSLVKKTALDESYTYIK